MHMLFLMQILASNINKAPGKNTLKGYTLSEKLLFLLDIFYLY